MVQSRILESLQESHLPNSNLADCSRILANYYLQKYDKYAAEICAKANAAYFRYADDQMILLKSVDRIEGIMLLLTRNLDRHGLRVNQKKVDLWTIKELQANRCRNIHAIFVKKGDNKDKTLVRKFAEAYLAMSEVKPRKSWNGGLPLLNRLLWANIESLPQKLFNKLITRYTAREYLLRADCGKLVRVHELNQKRRKPFDLKTHLKNLGTESVHNAFHHEVFSFAKEIKDRKLAKFFQTRIKDLEKKMVGDEIS